MIRVLLIRVLGVAATFGLGVYLARVLGDAGYGTYTFLLGLAGFVAVVGQAGSGMALIKLRLGADDRPGTETRGLYAWHLVLSVAGVAVLAAVVAQIPGRAHSFGTGPVVAMTLAVLAGLVVTNCYQSVKRSSLAILPATLMVPLSVMAATWALGLTTAGEVVVVYAAAAALWFAVFAGAFLAGAGRLPAGRSVTVRWGGWTRSAAGFLTGQFGHALLFTLLPAAYGFVAEPAEMGQFSAAHRLAAATLIAFNAISVYATPQFADARLMGDAGARRRLMRRVIGGSMALALPVLAVLLVLPRTLIDLIYGPGYAPAAELLPVLAIGICLHAATGPLGNFLLMNGAARFYSTASILAGLAGTGAIMTLGQEAGPLAAAWALAATLLVWKGLMVLRTLALYRAMARRDG